MRDHFRSANALRQTITLLFAQNAFHCCFNRKEESGAEKIFKEEHTQLSRRTPPIARTTFLNRPRPAAAESRGEVIEQWVAFEIAGSHEREVGTIQSSIRLFVLIYCMYSVVFSEIIVIIF